jgi:peptidyl-prolyl cis-trans isomerase A (cyclophilin A)
MTVRRSIATLTFSALLAAAAATTSAQTPAKPATAAPAQTKPAPAKPAATPTTQKPATAKPATAKPATAKPAPPNPALRTPAKLKDVAPATFRANFETSIGVFVVEVTRAWAPKGADRFYNLVKYGYFDGNRFFRVIPNFMVQFGINGDPKLNAAWSEANIGDDPVTQTNKRGYVTFATRGPNTRTTQLFINFRDNGGLDSQGFAPFGQVVSGMEVVDKINAEHRETPEQGLIQSQGNAYLMKQFPRLDFIKKASIEKPAGATAPAKTTPAIKPAPPVKK